jgi:hypothetical protein
MLETIHKLKFSEPRRNLPGRKGIATEEDRFTIAFARAYRAASLRIHARSKKTELAMAREIPVNGYGIADLVAVMWNPEMKNAVSVDDLAKDGAVVSRAFECKIKDWRSALTQAGRYRFFAHQAIVVLPVESCRLALVYLETFQLTRTGLWSFDRATGKIQVHHTPRSRRPMSPKYFQHSLHLVQKATRGVLPVLERR